jgi:Regulator of ribonuclease activity B/Family of unknown function (DUF695)
VDCDGHSGQEQDRSQVPESAGKHLGQVTAASCYRLAREVIRMRWLRNLFSRPAPEAATAPETLPVEAVPAASVTSWDSWRALTPDGPVSVALDLALEGRVPDPARPHLARIFYPLRAPDSDGQPTASEGEALARAEDVLSAAFAAVGATYAGRVTMAGVRHHLFYLADEARAAEALAVAAPGLAGYQPVLQGEDDPAWSGWKDELSPPPRARRWMEDRRMVEELARHGDRPEIARPVDHQASFATAEAREAFAAAAASLGFEPAVRRDDAPPPSPFSIDLRRDDPVTLRHLNGVTWKLCELATRHGGSYDGWEPGSV